MRLIFLVHGMGRHKHDGADAWWRPLVQQLIQSASALGAPPLTEENFVPISYDDALQKIVDNWQDKASAISKLGPLVGADKIAELVGWMKAPDSKLGQFFWTHVVDVLLYRYFSLVREKVRASVARQLVTALEAAEKQDTVNAYIVAHSLGTAVIHDVLHQLFLWPSPGKTKTYDPRRRKFDGLVMVSNVSRVLEWSPGVFGSLVRPEGAGGTAGCVLRFVNVRHKLDPFWMPQPFNPPAEWIPPAYKEGPEAKFRLVEVSHLHEANVHGLEHYFKHPAAHCALLRTIFGDQVISDDDLAQAERDFPAVKLPGWSAEKQDNLKRLLDYNKPGHEDDWQIWRKLVKDYVSAIN